MKIETSTSVQGVPNEAICTYTGLNINYSSSTITKSVTQQATDHWRLSDTRVTNKDRASSISDHSTHTTGLMVSEGVNPNARGMAFEANIHTRDSLFDLAEMAEIFSNSDPSDDLVTSNHSYAGVSLAT
jgi:hypothetical protein